MEEEKDGCLPFLDVLLTCGTDGSIQTSVCRKKTHADQYLDFSSHHPLSHKKSAASTLFRRGRDLSSNAVSRTKEEVHVVKALKGNGHPKRFIQRSAPPLSRAEPQRNADVGTDEDNIRRPPIVTAVRSGPLRAFDHLFWGSANKI